MSKLFVSDDESESITASNGNNSNNDTPMFDTTSELDDPVITEIPLIMKSKLPSQHLTVLQYPGRPKHRAFTGNNQVLQSRIKPSTNLIEVDVPIDTSRFFDEEKSELWGGVNKQTLSGVLCDLDGYYAVQVQDGELVLIPVNSVAQMRPNLGYIDKEVLRKKELNKLDQPHNYHNTSVQVVQMTVKGTNDTAPRLGGALTARKKVEEVEYKVLPWIDLTDEQAELQRGELMRVTNKQLLVSNVTEDDYLNMLVKDTLSSSLQLN